MPKTLNFINFFLRSLRSRFILSTILIELWQEHAKNDLLISTVNTFNDFPPPPPPLTKSTPHPLRSNPGYATAMCHVCRFNLLFSLFLVCSSFLSVRHRCHGDVFVYIPPTHRLFIFIYVIIFNYHSVYRETKTNRHTYTNKQYLLNTMTIHFLFF